MHILASSYSSQGSLRKRALVLGAAVSLTAIAVTVVGAPTPAMAADTQAVSHARIRSTTVPGSLAGTEVVLAGNKSTDIETLSGSGDLHVVARGRSCRGRARVEVKLDGRVVKKVYLSGARRFTDYTVATNVSSGSHVVRVRMMNNKVVKHKCNRDAFVSGSYLSQPLTSSSGSSGSGDVTVATSSGDYGVPAGTSLSVVNGDMTVTTDGTVINGVDLHGYLSIKADNVTVINSVIRGGATATSTKAVIMAWWGAKNLTVTNSTLVAEHPSLHIDGLSGSGFTATNLDIHGVVDAVKVIGGNVTLRSSYLHDAIHSDNDPNQSDGQTHDDGIQIEGGSNILIDSNVITGFHNAAVMVTQNYAATHDVTLRGNNFSGGSCQVNVTSAGSGGGGKAIYNFGIATNGFGPGNYGTTCPMRLPSSSKFSVSSNFWTATGTPANPNWF